MRLKERQKLSQDHEREITTMLQKIGLPAQQQPGSGNKAKNPTDIYVTKQFMVECKMTSRLSMPLKRTWLMRLREQALGFGVPGILALRFRFVTGGTFGYGGLADYFVVDANYFQHLLECERQVVHS